MTDEAPVSRDSGFAVWRQIADRLAADIRAGLHAPGSKLPAESELSARFDVNRHTLRRAIRALTEEGVLTPMRGSGTYVAARPIPYPLGPRTRFSEIISAAHRAPSGTLLRSAELGASAEVSHYLGIEPGEPVLSLDTLRSADGVPICVGTAYFPAARFPGLVAAFAASGSITKALEDQGISDYARRWTRVSAALADSRDAALLEQTPGRVVLVLESLNVDGSGQPIQFSRARFAADRVQFEVQD